MSALQTFQVLAMPNQVHAIHVCTPIKFKFSFSEEEQVSWELSFDVECFPAFLYTDVPGLLEVPRYSVNKRLSALEKAKKIEEPEGPLAFRARASAPVRLNPILPQRTVREALDKLMWERQALETMNIGPDSLLLGRNLYLNLLCYQHTGPQKPGWALALKSITVDLSKPCPALHEFY